MGGCQMVIKKLPSHHWEGSHLLPNLQTIYEEKIFNLSTISSGAGNISLMFSGNEFRS